jgi:hypothetical protein
MNALIDPREFLNVFSGMDPGRADASESGAARPRDTTARDADEAIGSPLP